MESNLPSEVRDLLRQRTGSQIPTKYSIVCFPGTSHTDPRRLPYSYRLEQWASVSFSSNEFWVSNIDGVFVNYETDKGVVVDTRIYEHEDAKDMQRKAIEAFSYDSGLTGCILKFPEGTSPHNSVTIVDLYDGSKWHESFGLNEYSVVDFLREATGSPIHPSNAKSFKGPYIPRDARGKPVLGKQTMFLEWVRSPHLLCSKCCKCSLFDIDLFVMHKQTKRTSWIEGKTESEFEKPDRATKEWKWNKWARTTDQYTNANTSRYYSVFYENGRVLALLLKKGPFTNHDETDMREDDPRIFDSTEEFAEHIKTQLNS